MSTDVEAVAKSLADTIIRDFDTRRRPVKLRGAAAKEKAFELLAEAGIPVNKKISPRDRGVHWDGRELAGNKQEYDHLLHELAHFQCASPDRWGIPELGMDVGPDGMHSKAVENYPEVFGDGGSYETLKFDEMEEEGRASLLGVLWERHIGANFYQNLLSHSWINEKPGEDSEWENTDTYLELQWLLEHGLIDQEGQPMLVFRDGSTKVTTGKEPS